MAANTANAEFAGWSGRVKGERTAPDRKEIPMLQRITAGFALGVVAAVIYAAPNSKQVGVAEPIAAPREAPKPLDLSGYWSCSGTIANDNGEVGTYETVTLIRAGLNGSWSLQTGAAGEGVQRGVGVLRGKFLDVAFTLPSGQPVLARYEVISDQDDPKPKGLAVQLNGSWQAIATKGTETLTFLRELQKK